MGKFRRKQLERLVTRQRGYHEAQAQEFQTYVPGSMNPHKGGGKGFRRTRSIVKADSRNAVAR